MNKYEETQNSKEEPFLDKESCSSTISMKESVDNAECIHSRGSPEVVYPDMLFMIGH